MNTHRIHILLGIIAIATILPYSAFGATFIAPEGEAASVRSETRGDVYAASNAVIIAAPVHGDIFAAGESVDISGTSDNSVFAVGRAITISGDAKDDVRAAGNTISLMSQVSHDVFAAGASVFLGPQSRVGGDAYIAGSDITIAGTIAGTLRVAGEKVTIAKTAVITGDVIAYKNAPMVEDGATISGKTNVIQPKMHPRRERQYTRGTSLIVAGVSRFLFAFCLLSIAPVFVQKVRGIGVAHPFSVGLTGLAACILVLPVTAILLISGIGFHLGIFVLVGMVFFAVLALACSSLITGHILMQLFAKDKVEPSLTWKHAAAGAVTLSVISMLGPLGALVLCLLFLISLGAILKITKELFYAR